MTELELHKYLEINFPQENEKCEWKEFKHLKHSISAHPGDDIISYVSAIANMKGGHLIIGVEDKTLNIVGIQDFHTYKTNNLKLKIVADCPNLSSEGLEIEEFITTDTHKTVWILHIPKHPYRQGVYAHKKLKASLLQHGNLFKKITRFYESFYESFIHVFVAKRA